MGVACADRDQLGEEPLWDVDEQRLYWIGSYGPAIHRPSYMRTASSRVFILKIRKSRQAG
jgi:sugar lactone lactonase YvrE